MAEILRDLPKKGKKNLKDLPEGNREYLDEPKYTDEAIKGDKSESGSNSYAKDNQLAIAKLKNGTTQPFSKYADSQKRGF